MKNQTIKFCTKSISCSDSYKQASARRFWVFLSTNFLFRRLAKEGRKIGEIRQKNARNLLYIHGTGYFVRLSWINPSSEQRFAIGAQAMYIACNDTSVIVINFRKSKTHAITDTYCNVSYSMLQKKWSCQFFFSIFQMWEKICFFFSVHGSEMLLPFFMFNFTFVPLQKSNLPFLQQNQWFCLLTHKRQKRSLPGWLKRHSFKKI